MRFLSLIIVIMFFACNMDVNTVDPQANNSIDASKKDGFFISEYYLDSSSSNVVDLHEAWIEYKWKKKVSALKQSKVKTNGVQLNFKVFEFKIVDLVVDEYFITWEMEVQGIGVVGKNNGVYNLFINNGHIPDSMHVNIKKKNSDGEYKVVNVLKLYRK